MLFKACIPAYECEFVVCSLTVVALVTVLSYEKGVCQNPLSSMNQQVTGMENSWICVCFYAV